MSNQSIDVLLFTALRNVRQADGVWRTVTTSDVKIEVSLDDGATFQPAERTGVPLMPDFFRLPPSPRPIHYLVRATPTVSTLFPVACRFTHDPGGGVFSRGGVGPDDDRRLIEPGAFPMPVRTSLEESAILAAFGFDVATLIHHTVHLSRVRDISRVALGLINQGQPIGAADDWLPDWNFATLDRVHVGAEPLIEGRKLVFEDRPVPFFQKEVAILEIADVRVPLLAVSWSSGVLRGGRPTPFLIYLHPDLGQNADWYGGQPYPGTRYLFSIGFRDLFFKVDPVVLPGGSKGLTTQVAMVKKAAVVVVPIPKLEGHIAALKDATLMEEVLREIQSFFYHRADNSEPPQLGRVALAAYSNGAGMHLNDFLGRNISHPFLVNLVRELYLMDPRMNDDSLANLVGRWAGSGDTADKRIRVYLGAQHAAFLRLIGQTRFTPSPGTQQTADGRRSVTLLESPAWVAAATAAGAIKVEAESFRKWQVVHEAIPGTMIAHALQLSGFEPAFDLGF